MADVLGPVEATEELCRKINVSQMPTIRTSFVDMKAAVELQSA